MIYAIHIVNAKVELVAKEEGAQENNGSRCDGKFRTARNDWLQTKMVSTVFRKIVNEKFVLESYAT
jgi:hypothetical protein